MSKLIMALGSMMGAKEKSCPDCGMPLNRDGSCADCGYGEEEMDDEAEDAVETQALLDLRDHLQAAIKIIDRLMVD